MDDFDEAVLKEGRMTVEFEPNSEAGVQPSTSNPDVKSDTQSDSGIHGPKLVGPGPN